MGPAVPLPIKARDVWAFADEYRMDRRVTLRLIRAADEAWRGWYGTRPSDTPDTERANGHPIRTRRNGSG